MQDKEYPRLQVEAAWALTNIASGTQQQTQTIIDKGGMRLFVDSLKSANLDLVEQCIWALGNISADSTNYRDIIISIGGVENLLSVYDAIKNHIERHQNWVWALSNLCRGTPSPDPKHTLSTIPYFLNIILQENKNIEIINDSSWALCNILVSCNSRQNNPTSNTQVAHSLVTHPCFTKILFILKHNKENYTLFQIPLIKLLGNLAYIHDTIIDVSHSFILFYIYVHV